MNLYAQCSPSQGTPQQGGGSPLGGFLPLIIIFAIFYFLLIRPQQKKQKEQKKMIAELKKGDFVLTSGGVYGTVVNVKSKTVELKIDDNVKIQVLKSSVSQVTEKTDLE